MKSGIATTAIAGAGGLALGIVASKFMGAKASSEFEAAVYRLSISRDPPYRYWLKPKLLMSYTHVSKPAALYAFCIDNDVEGNVHKDNPEALVSVTSWAPGTYEFECALFGGPPEYKVYYDGVRKLTLSTSAAYQIFTV